MRWLKTRPSIHDGPPEVAKRLRPGDWEAEAIFFPAPGQALLVAHQRTLHLTLVVRPASLKAHPTATELGRLMQSARAQFQTHHDFR